MTVNGKNFADMLELMDDSYLDEALEYANPPRIKSFKTLFVLAAALIIMIATCIAVTAAVELVPKPKKYLTDKNAEKFMETFGSFYDYDEERTFVVSDEALRLEVEYPEDGVAVIKIVDVDYSLAPFDTHPNIIINGVMIHGVGGKADPIEGIFDPDTFISGSGYFSTDDLSLIKYAVIDGTTLRIDRMAFASEEAFEEAYSEFTSYGHMSTHRPEDFSPFDSYKLKAAEEGKLLDTKENPIYDRVSILTLVNYDDEGCFCEVIGDWEIEVVY